jgi:hypothetical protein
VATQSVVFVQGEKKKEDKFPWMFFHLDPWKDPAPSPVKLVYFDYPAGKLKIWDNHILKRGKAPTQVPDSEADLTPKVKVRLRNGTVDASGPDRPSILALYDWVKKQPRGSIRSLQIFSHGWIGGPIIWDTYEYDPAGDELDMFDGKDRDPHDADPRIRDFVGNNPLSGFSGMDFAQAFASDALIKIWGCVAPEGVRGPMRNYLRAPKGSRGDAARQAHLKDYLESIEGSYAMEMAKRLDLAVWASPMGYGSEPHTKVPMSRRRELKVRYMGEFPPKLDQHQWWRVSWFFRNQDKGVQFYKDVLKARVDAVDFVEYKRSWFEDAKRVATASGVPNPLGPRGLQQRLTDVIDSLGIPWGGP